MCLSSMMSTIPGPPTANDLLAMTRAGFGRMNRCPNPSPLSPELFLRNIFACKAVQEGGVIRRKARDIEKFVGREVFRAELRRRGFQAVENAGQIVVFCNREPLRRFL